jgi:two-component system, OmpR family, sensor kinase
MISRISTWVRSMQAYMIGFAMSVVVVLTLVSLIIIELAGPPRRAPVSIYDLALVIQGRQPARDGLLNEFEFSHRRSAPGAESDVERRLARVLAEDLGTSAESVRIYLGNRSTAYFDYVERQLLLYEQDGRDSPTVSGTVIAAIRQSDGNWQVFARESQNGYQDVWFLLRASPWIGALVLIPFSMWFSTLIARPMRAFTQAVRRLGSQARPVTVPVVGPNETRIAALALNEMQDRILAFVQERTTMVGAIAHDLRTPLNNLRFRIAAAPESVRAAAESDIEQLDSLINSILHYVENEGRPLSIEILDLTSLLQSLVDDNTDRGRDVTLNAENVMAEGDIVLLRRLFSNLINNSVQYSNKVMVSLKADGGNAIVEILDDGPGMPVADLARAFEPFFRGERSRNRETGGVGLGLSIAQSIAQAHRGSLTLENTADMGLLARVVLPLNRTE